MGRSVGRVALTIVGAVAGYALGGASGAVQGAALGYAAGGALFAEDQKLPTVEGSRLDDMQVQTSAYGVMIPIVYGYARLAGNVIWMTDIKEVKRESTQTSSGGKGGGGSQSQTTTTYSYYATLAIAICEGEVDELMGVWADAKFLTANQVGFNFYKGSETQTADPIIESYEGVGNVPAYRGLCYAVVEDFPLADYGNRIPNFTFEVLRNLDSLDEDAPEKLVKSVIMIPGSGEFVYDTTVQYKIPGVEVRGHFIQQTYMYPINKNTYEDKADALVALEQLQRDLPNLEWIGVVVTWFGTNLDAGLCEIKPGVEFKEGAVTEPDTWSVGTFTRDTAHEISLNEEGNVVYGGSVNDDSVIRYLQKLRAEGYNIMLYPMFFMDTELKPWRGRVTGSVSDVANFFTKTNGYNAFITHYANLGVGLIDAFVIGSELIGLTSVRDTSDNSFPAVDALVSLAASIKSILGASVDVTYAADWSEYHHTDGGWYNLDPLWASPNIDFIGIDAYFPLTDEPQSGITYQEIYDGWTSGEGYDWYYTDEARTTKATIQDKYAWKNIEWFLSNYHVNPDSSTTSWVPNSKKVWFTEYGFPSVDGASNQPNVFYDPTSSESYFPRFSKGRVDFGVQEEAIKASEKAWEGSTYMERLFVWTWDARPYPIFPTNIALWTDGPMWKTGHWINGKFGVGGQLATIVRDICNRAGIGDDYLDVSQLTDKVEGYTIASPIVARRAIGQLASAYIFDAVESDGVLKFVSREKSYSSVETIAESDLIRFDNSDGRDIVLKVERKQEVDLPKKINVIYINRADAYNTATQTATRRHGNGEETQILSLPLCLEGLFAKTLSYKRLYSQWVTRNSYEFILSNKYVYLEPTDVITLTANGATHEIRLTSTEIGQGGRIVCKGMSENYNVHDFYMDGVDDGYTGEDLQIIQPSSVEFFESPLLPGDPLSLGGIARAVVTAEDETYWRGAVIYRSDDGGESGGNTWNSLTDVTNLGKIGTLMEDLLPGSVYDFDTENTIDIYYPSENLFSVTEIALLNGANSCLINDEVIQFKNVSIIDGDPKQLRLSNLLRGRLGTEFAAASTHSEFSKVVILDTTLAKLFVPYELFGAERQYKAVSLGSTLSSSTETDFTYRGVSLLPYSPVGLEGELISNDWTITWIRRTRTGGQLRDYIGEVPLNEEYEAYEIDIMDGSTVVNTYSSSTTSFTYTSAQQISDFGSNQSSITVNIYQISSDIGRGRVATKTF